MKKELDFSKGNLRDITQRFCVRMESLSFSDYENRSPFVNRAFNIITAEVIKYDIRLHGGKVK